MKVAIVGGSAKRTGGLLELDRDWHIWGINLAGPEWLWRSHIRIDKWFHLHKRADLENDLPGHTATFEEWASTHPEMEFVLLEPWPSLPEATIFPHEELRKMTRGAYHCSSFDWMIAYALHLGATEIFLTGLQMRNSEEPLSSQACIEYWCGYAEGKGCIVTAASDSDLFYNYHLVRSRYAYGYDSWDLIEDRTKTAEDYSWAKATVRT